MGEDRRMAGGGHTGGMCQPMLRLTLSSEKPVRGVPPLCTLRAAAARTCVEAEAEAGGEAGPGSLHTRGKPS